MNAAIDTRRDQPSGQAVSACPACGGIAATQVGAVVPGYSTFVGGKSFSHPPYCIKSCPECGLYFKSNTMGLEELPDYYARLGGDSFEHDENFPTDAILRAILASLPDGAKVLDFGCSSGRIHEGSARRLQTYGVEINAEAAELARRRGITIITEEQATGGAFGPFDLVVTADVYEHLAHPAQTLEGLAAALGAGGRLAIVTGNGDAVRTRDWMGEFWYFRPEGHFHMMSERHVQWLARRLAMQVEQLHECCHYDLPMTARLRQRVQSFAYGEFKRASSLSSVLHFVPLLNRAANWPLAPALTCTADHFVVVLRKS